MRKFLKQACEIFRSVRRQLTYLFLFALFVVLLIEFDLKDRPAICNWKHATTGANLVAHLLRSYMASYIFFLVGAQWDKIANRKLLAPRVNIRLSNLLLEFNNILVLMCNLKARTSFSERTIREIQRKEWPGYINEVFWLRENYEEWTPPCFVHMISQWGHYGENSRDQSDQIVSRFESFDPMLTVLMDVIHQQSRQLIWLGHANEIYTNFTFGERPDTLPELDSFIHIRCFGMHEAIQQGFRLVEYCKNVDDKVIRWQLESIERLLDLKGKYSPSKN